MRKGIVFLGKIKEGKLVFRDKLYKERMNKYCDENNGKDFIITLKAVNDAKSLLQLNYYWGVVIPAFMGFSGDQNKDRIDLFLRNHFLQITDEVMGEKVVMVPSLKLDSLDLDKPSMSQYIGNCINLLIDMGGHIPQSQWDNSWR